MYLLHCFTLFRTISLIHTISQESRAIIPELLYRNVVLDVDNLNLSRDMDLVMYGRPESIFKVKINPFGEYQDDIFEIPLIFFSIFESVVDLESGNEIHRMGDTIQVYGPDQISAL